MNRYNGEKGAHIIEFALVMFFFIFALLGVIELGLLSFCQANVRTAALESVARMKETKAGKITAADMNAWLDANFPLGFAKPVVVDYPVGLEDPNAPVGKDIPMFVGDPTSDGVPHLYQLTFKHRLLFPFLRYFASGMFPSDSGGEYIPIKISVSYYTYTDKKIDSYWKQNVTCECETETEGRWRGKCECSNPADPVNCGGKPIPILCTLINTSTSCTPCSCPGGPPCNVSYACKKEGKCLSGDIFVCHKYLNGTDMGSSSSGSCPACNNPCSGGVVTFECLVRYICSLGVTGECHKYVTYPGYPKTDFGPSNDPGCPACKEECGPL